MFSLGMSSLSVSALKTDEIIEKMTEKMHEIESSEEDDKKKIESSEEDDKNRIEFSEEDHKNEKYLFMKKVLNKYSISCDYFNANKHMCRLFLDERACDSFKYFLLFRSLYVVYRKYDRASLDGFLKELDDFIDGLGTLVFERSEKEKRWDDTYIQEFYRYEIFSWFVFQ